MADYCDKCADELGFEKETYPLFCEGCKEHFEEISFIKRVLSWFNKNDEEND